MSISTIDLRNTFVENVSIDDDSLSVELSDGRSVAVPLAWFPRLLHGTPKERSTWRLIGRGQGIHWPDLDEDISIDNLLCGRPSGESQRSFQNWLNQRHQPGDESARLKAQLA